MTPEERQLLTQLFARIREASAGPRDREAEDFIAQQVREQPYAPYLMAQTVIIQEEALKQAGARIEELEAALKAKENAGAGSFLGGLGQSGLGQSGLGKSVFGGGSVPAVGRAEAAPEAARPSPWGRSPGAPQTAPMGQTFNNPMNPMNPNPMAAQPGPGGGFLQTAMATAAGVAGGALLAHGLQSMFGGQAHAAVDPKALLGDQAAAPAATEGGMIPNIFGPDDPGLTEAHYGDDSDPGFDIGGDDGGGDDWV